MLHSVKLKDISKLIKEGKRYLRPEIWELEALPIHPEEILREDFFEPLGISQTQLAKEIGVSFRAVNELVNCRIGITPEMALRLFKRFGTTPNFWLNLQNNYDFWKAAKKLEMVR